MIAFFITMLFIYYDHRRDDFAGGLALNLHDPNFFGHMDLIIISGHIHTFLNTKETGILTIITGGHDQYTTVEVELLER